MPIEFAVEGYRSMAEVPTVRTLVQDQPHFPLIFASNPTAGAIDLSLYIAESVDPLAEDPFLVLSIAAESRLEIPDRDGLLVGSCDWMASAAGLWASYVWRRP